jgi:hypothetical protein
MIVRISVEINAPDANIGNHGDVSFSEETGLDGENLDVAFKVFNRIHVLLEAMRVEHGSHIPIRHFPTRY